MSGVAGIHVEKETLEVAVNIPGHDPRTTTALFTHSKKHLVAREDGRCWVCGLTAEETGHPLEAHHHPIERSLANMIDWNRFAEDCKKGLWGPSAQAFDWDTFFKGAKQVTVHVKPDPDNGEDFEPYSYSYQVPKDPYLFVDDMTVNGELLCKAHHTGKDEGKHDLPFPLWVAQRYGIEGYKFSDVEIIHHGHEIHGGEQ